MEIVLTPDREALRRDVQVGLEELEKGEHEEYALDEMPRLASEIKARGRNRLQNTG